MERDENVIDLKDLTLFVYSKKLLVQYCNHHFQLKYQAESLNRLWN